MTRGMLRSALAEPRVPDAPSRVWRDWLLVGSYLVGALAEIAFRDSVGPKPVAVAVTFVLAAAIWWRRTHPLVATVAAFGVVMTTDIVLRILGEPPLDLYSGAVVLIVPYALFRWGSGREAAIGLAVMVATLVESVTLRWTGFGDAIGGLIVLLLAAAVGYIVRFQVSWQRRALDDVKRREREQLARELHDSVAHHVSAIAIQAQAGRAVAANRPEAAVELLATIEEEASRTLAEMRAMVGALRNDGAAELRPLSGIEDIERLAESAGTLDVRVERIGDLDSIRPSIQVALFRMAQESITNAARHSRNATEVVVQVSADPDVVRLEVTDDGEHSSHGEQVSEGYGLIGMTERAHLLGGSLHAGPGLDRGWTVSATLPRSGVSS